MIKTWKYKIYFHFSIQTTWKAEVRGMLENLKEKAGELKSKEMELVEREKAVSRRQASIHQILECKECKRCKPCHQIIQREVIYFFCWWILFLFKSGATFW